MLKCMPNFEANAIITAADYNRDIGRRVYASDMLVGSLYTAMLRLENETWQAARIAAKMLGLKDDSSNPLVEVAMVDADMAPMIERYRTELPDGWIENTSGLVVRTSVAASPLAVTEGYFKDYATDAIDEAYFLMCAQHVPVLA